MIEASQIISAILVAIDGATIQVMNPRNDGLHFDAIVISSHFSGKSLVEQHQMVMAPLKELFASKLHALSLKTYTPEEWEKIDQ
ncbi:MAG: BolA/IbaG family iron-sulfur metabolism protein [Simkaniaceae bacterium]|jgi:acid stress-induced BolA-like protein IbaG/YrbA|nr:MAG: BolA/IbaG family iron-sulfur metabolism protein [Simkaniaceae bacterium]